MRKCFSALLCLALVWPSASSAAAVRSQIAAPSFKSAPSAPRLALPPSALGTAPTPLSVDRGVSSVERAVTAAAQLRTAQTTLMPAGGVAAVAQTPDSDRSLAAAAWEGGSKVKTRADSVDAAPAPEISFRALGRRSAVVAAGTAVLVPGPALAASSPWIGETVKQLLPYGTALAGIAATAVVERGARWALSKLAQRRGWDQNQIVVLRLVTSIVVWTAGISVSLSVAGVPTETLLASLGVGGIAVTMSAKELINNLLEGVKVLIVRPFRMGDTLVIGAKTYKARAMSLRFVELERYTKSTTLMTYTNMGSKPITVQRPYEPANSGITFRRIPLKGALEAMAGHAKVSVAGTTAWLAAGVGILIGLPYLRDWVAHPWLTAAFPWLQGVAMLFAVRQADRWVTSLVDRVAERSKWDQTTAVFARLAAQVLVYTIGLTVGLSALGVTWTTLLASLGATSIVIGWASADVIGNLLQWFYIVFFRPFRVGDIIEVSGATGTVVDMNLQYVVLAHKDGQHTLVPYSNFRDSAFTVLDAADADTTAPKASAEDDIPPSSRKPE